MSDLKLNTPLSMQEVEFRVQSISDKKYATILVYKDARVDMNRLNKIYGAGRWQRKHEVVNGNMFCSVGIYHEESGSWAWVQDCGIESQTEKEKGQASDSFKRACFNLGIGIELYDYPFVCVKLNDNEVQETGKQKPKYRGSYNLKLKSWVWAVQRNSEGELTFLSAKDSAGNLRFKHGDYNSKLALDTTKGIIEPKA